MLSLMEPVAMITGETGIIVKMVIDNTTVMIAIMAAKENVAIMRGITE